MPTRRRGYLPLCLVLLPFVVSGQAHGPKDVDGWKKAKWGMSEEELAGVFGAEARKLPARETNGDRYFTLVLDDVTAGNFHFTARLLMDPQSNKLSGVSLVNSGAPVLFSSFKDLEQALVREYGEPSKRVVTSKLVTVWEFPSSTIELIHGRAARSGAYLVLNYDRREKIRSK